MRLQASKFEYSVGFALPIIGQPAGRFLCKKENARFFIVRVPALLSRLTAAYKARMMLLQFIFSHHETAIWTRFFEA